MPPPKLTRLELQIMEALWTAGPSSVREIQMAMPAATRPAYTTVQTIVSRLEAKKAVRRVKKVGNAYIFEPQVTRSTAQRRLIDELLSFLRRTDTAGRRAPDRSGQADARGRPGSGADAPETRRERTSHEQRSHSSPIISGNPPCSPAAMGLMTLAFRRNAAAVRHALWLAASIKFLVPFAALMAIGSYVGLRAPVRLVQHEVVVATTAALPLSPFDASPMTSAPVSSLGCGCAALGRRGAVGGGLAAGTRNVVGPLAAGRGDRPRRIDCRVRRRSGHAAPRRAAGRRPPAHRPGRVRCRDGARCVRHRATGVAVVADDWPASERRAGRNDLRPRTVARPAPRQSCRGDCTWWSRPCCGSTRWCGGLARGWSTSASARATRRSWYPAIDPRSTPNRSSRRAGSMSNRRSPALPASPARISESGSSESCRTARPSA